jgi:hypothetical protein
MKGGPPTGGITSRCRPTSGGCGSRPHLLVTRAPLAAERQNRYAEHADAEIGQNLKRLDAALPRPLK